mmetsp:Transcript_565/g.1569  ORF Transcript_565/g.1569 Transcript_565/m.1569 type:complete len:338 (-) Transcript_565:426-1439(-)
MLRGSAKGKAPGLDDVAPDLYPQGRSSTGWRLLSLYVLLPLSVVFWQAVIRRAGSGGGRPVVVRPATVNATVAGVAALPTATGQDLDTILYSLSMWDTLIQASIGADMTYAPGQHGITQAKYLGKKTEFFFSEIQSAHQSGLAVKTICEVGMYAGASSQFFLLSNKGAHLYTFDTFSKGKSVSVVAARLLQQLGRATPIKGSSLDTVPRFPMDFPGTLCDIVFVDGSKKYDIRSHDLKNLRAISHNKTLVLMDEVCSAECVRGGPQQTCAALGSKGINEACLAYRDAVLRGDLEVRMCQEDHDLPAGYPEGDYVCSANFSFSRGTTSSSLRVWNNNL